MAHQQQDQQQQQRPQQQQQSPFTPLYSFACTLQQPLALLRALNLLNGSMRPESSPKADFHFLDNGSVRICFLFSNNSMAADAILPAEIFSEWERKRPYLNEEMLQQGRERLKQLRQSIEQKQQQQQQQQGGKNSSKNDEQQRKNNINDKGSNNGTTTAPEDQTLLDDTATASSSDKQRAAHHILSQLPTEPTILRPTFRASLADFFEAVYLCVITTAAASAGSSNAQAMRAFFAPKNAQQQQARQQQPMILPNQAQQQLGAAAAGVLQFQQQNAQQYGNAVVGFAGGAAAAAGGVSAPAPKMRYDPDAADHIVAVNIELQIGSRHIQSLVRTQGVPAPRFAQFPGLPDLNERVRAGTDNVRFVAAGANAPTTGTSSGSSTNNANNSVTANPVFNDLGFSDSPVVNSVSFHRDAIRDVLHDVLNLGCEQVKVEFTAEVFRIHGVESSLGSALIEIPRVSEAVYLAKEWLPLHPNRGQSAFLTSHISIAFGLAKTGLDGKASYSTRNNQNAGGGGGGGAEFDLTNNNISHHHHNNNNNFGALVGRGGAAELPFERVLVELNESRMLRVTHDNTGGMEVSFVVLPLAQPMS